MSRRQLLGFAIAIASIALLGLGRADELPQRPARQQSGDGAMLCAATYSVVFKELSSRYGVMTLTALQELRRHPLLRAFCLFFPWPAAWAWRDMAVIVFLGAFVTLGAYLLYNWSVTQVKVTLAAAYVNLIPVFTLLLALSAAGETLSPLQWLACAAVLAGIGVGQLPSGKPRSQAITMGDESPPLGYGLDRGHPGHGRATMSDMILLARAKALLSHHPFYPGRCQGAGGWREAVGRRALHRRAVGGGPPVQADRGGQALSVGRSDPVPEGFMTP